MNDSVNRRKFLAQSAGSLSAVWVSSHWSSLLSAAVHARKMASADGPPKFEFFTAEEATEVDAITARIIPSDQTPGAREAGVLYFIDKGLVTFGVEDQKAYRQGLPAIQDRVKEMFPAVSKFSAATPDQQDEVLKSFDQGAGPSRLSLRAQATGQNFFETIRQHTIAGFLIDPDYGGNRDGVGWKLIGREREHMFQPPFGYYDKDYPGWQPAEKEAGKK
jgi:gluconate 2-dehydrogenase gamma chain